MLENITAGLVTGGLGYVDGTNHAKDDRARELQRLREEEKFGWEREGQESVRRMRPTTEEVVRLNRDVLKQNIDQGNERFGWERETNESVQSMRPFVEGATKTDYYTKVQNFNNAKLFNAIYPKVMSNSFNEAFDRLNAADPERFPKTTAVRDPATGLFTIDVEGETVSRPMDAAEVQNMFYYMFNPKEQELVNSKDGSGGSGGSGGSTSAELNVALNTAKARMEVLAKRRETTESKLAALQAQQLSWGNKFKTNKATPEQKAVLDSIAAMTRDLARLSAEEQAVTNQYSLLYSLSLRIDPNSPLGGVLNLGLSVPPNEGTGSSVLDEIDARLGGSQSKPEPGALPGPAPKPATKPAPKPATKPAPKPAPSVEPDPSPSGPDYALGLGAVSAPQLLPGWENRPSELKTRLLGIAERERIVAELSERLKWISSEAGAWEFAKQTADEMRSQIPQRELNDPGHAMRLGRSRVPQEIARLKKAIAEESAKIKWARRELYGEAE